jgi:AcrR family transcriptional regulator
MKDTRARRRPMQDRSTATHDAILDATQLLAQKVGIEAVTTREVLRRAGVSAGTLYQYFASREALVAAWEIRQMTLRAQRLLGVVADLIATNPPLEEAVRTATLTAVDLLAEHVSYYRDPNLGTLVSERHEVMEKLVLAVAGALDCARDRHRFRVPDLRIAANLLVVSVFHGVIQMARLAPGSPERALFRAEIAELSIHYLVRDPQRNEDGDRNERGASDERSGTTDDERSAA